MDKPLVKLKRLKDENALKYPDTQLLIYEDKAIFIDTPESGNEKTKIIIPYEEIRMVRALHDIFDDTGSLEIITYKKKVYQVEYSNGDLVSQARGIIDKKVEALRLEKKISKMPVFYFPHHISISVKNLDESEKFYRLFGFKKVYEWTAKDKSLAISHLKSRSFILEIFCYADFRELPEFSRDITTDLPVLGVKHFALKVLSIKKAREDLINKGVTPHTEITQGKTEIQYFFVKDPNGILLEIVQDNRYLDAEIFSWRKEIGEKKPIKNMKESSRYIGLPEDEN
jgi:glyoxylase I family protein